MTRNAENLSPLLYPDWAYLRQSQEQFRAAEWQLLNRQREQYYAELQADHALRLLRSMEHDPSFGYPINTYQHCLQAATLAYRAGCDEETIVVALFHDVGFTICPQTHGSFAAELLGAYISEKNRWMLRHHGYFQCYHCHEHPEIPDRHIRERWRDHPHFEWTAEFVAEYDQDAMRPDYDNAPLEFFAPMVQRVFTRKPNMDLSPS